MSLIAPILRHADIFEDLTPTQVELIASISTMAEYQMGELIFVENAASAELYVVADGEVEIQIDPSIVARENIDRPSELKTIAAFRRGQSFGEIALLDQGLRSATARCAKNETRLVVIPRDKLIQLCDTYPQLGYRLMYNLASDLALKIRNTDMKIREQLLWMQQHEESPPPKTEGA
jgi:CRP-like cAMP-binding protein